MVPKTRVAVGMLIPLEGGAMEPIGQRIVETAQLLEATENRDDASPFVAYVPVGSIKKGEALVTTGGSGKTLRCSICRRDGSEGPRQRAVPRRPPRSSYFDAAALRHQDRQAAWPMEPL